MSVSFAAGKCTSLQAKCAIEVGGECNPKTGHWCYGIYQGHICGRSGTPQGGLTALFNDCISRGLAGRK
jgi:hypothetical protein